MTPEQIEAFQREHQNHLGAPLDVDGIIGPETEWSLDFETLCPVRQHIVLAAREHLGLREEPPGSNSDATGLIRAWLARCGARPGDPWCAAFASWCLSEGLRELVCQAGAQALGKRFPVTTLPTAGDLFWFPTARVRGHVGLVIGVGPHEVMTIEGNCGNAVRCVRRDRKGLRFSRTVEDTSGMIPGVVPTVELPPWGTR